MRISCSFYYVILGKCFVQKHRILLITICFCSEIQKFAQHTLFLLEKHKNSLSALYFRSKNQKIRSAHLIFAQETQKFSQHTIFSFNKHKNSLSTLCVRSKNKKFAQRTLFSLEKHIISLSTLYFCSRNQNFAHHFFKSATTTNYQ